MEILSIEKLEEIEEKLKDLPKYLIENCYCHPLVFDKIFAHLIKDKREISRGPLFNCYGIKIISDENVPENTYFLCEPRLFEIWKILINDPWINKSDMTVDLLKVADTLYRQEKEFFKDSESYLGKSFTIWPKEVYLDINKKQF